MFAVFKGKGWRTIHSQIVEALRNAELSDSKSLLLLETSHTVVRLNPQGYILIVEDKNYPKTAVHIVIENRWKAAVAGATDIVKRVEDSGGGWSPWAICARIN